jgi:hypothetical protein
VLNRGWWATGKIGEVATANSFWELTVGSSSKEKTMVMRALTVATPCKASLYTLRNLV